MRCAAFGAEVIVCPTDVDPEDPRSYYSVSSRLERETPNSWKANQYDNPSNAQAHYEQTGPEIWEQTGGTDRSPGRRRRHRRHDLRRRQIPEGAQARGQGLGHRHLRFGVQEIQGDRRLRQERDLSLHHRRHRRGLPAAERRLQPDRSLREGHRPRRGDHDRRIAREEGIFAGNSAGSAMAGLLQLADRFKAGETVVVIFHDHGTRYLGKMYNPDWMREKGFLDRKGLTARDLVANREKARRSSRSIATTRSRRPRTS